MGAKQAPSLHSDLCPQGDPVETYRVLESVLQGGDSRWQSSTETHCQQRHPVATEQPRNDELTPRGHGWPVARLQVPQAFPWECLMQALFQSVTDDVKVDAGDVLVAVSHCHFRAMMSEIRGHLKALAELSKEFVFNVLIP
ncbi:hypothetical protein QYF61_025740 [Mycteria americana]|uniref:Uncharacterized protein n=1 Tax=Mycteria americana TaxID=33587 RepID=A0AAN7M9R0_MYCAM|nr:hypothetical protein QYF61_025740 [Mycteria americana]